MKDCEDYDPITHPKYSIAGCYGCGHCKIYTELGTDCMLGYMQESFHKLTKGRNAEIRLIIVRKFEDDES